MDFHKQFKEVRKAMNISQKELSSVFNVDQKTISHWETGRNEPSLEILRTFCTKYKININWLLTGEGSMFIELKENTIKEDYNLTNNEYKLLSNFKLLPPDRQSILLDMSNGMAEPYRHSTSGYFREKLSA